MTKYNDQIKDEIAKLLTSHTVIEVCEQVGITERTFWNWMRDREEFFQSSARSFGTKALRDLVEAEVMLNQDHEPKDVPLMRERMHHARWKCSKLLSNLFSEKTQVEHSGDVGTPSVEVILSSDAAPPTS
jgi:hypothetical protein